MATFSSVAKYKPFESSLQNLPVTFLVVIMRVGKELTINDTSHFDFEVSPDPSTDAGKCPGQQERFPCLSVLQL